MGAKTKGWDSPRTRWAVLITLAMLYGGGCSRRDPMRTWGKYQQAVESGKSTIPSANDFTRLFPNAQCSIQYYTGVVGDPAWQATVELYGRYEMHLQIPVSFNEQRTKVISYGEPTFVLLEVTSAVGRDRTYGMNKRFGSEEWARVVAAEGDLTALGVKLAKDKSIPGF